MSEDEKRQSEPDPDVELEIRQGRKFTAREAMARLAGPGAMKGASPVSPVQQAETEIGNWLNANLADTNGALRAVLHRNLKGSDHLLAKLDRPLDALAAYIRSILESDYLLKEIVRAADIEWGRAMDERPHFERDGVPAEPDDPYTVTSVQRALSDAQKLLSASED